ncbi:MAG TPA: hypothetical protein VNP36_01240 [Burkholderiales bacterium]|nr:hypothetical protein [Burkholderiales bacterium]
MATNHETARLDRRCTGVVVLTGSVILSASFWRAARRLSLWLLRPPSDAIRQAKSETWRRISAHVLARRVHHEGGCARSATRLPPAGPLYRGEP